MIRGLAWLQCNYEYTIRYSPLNFFPIFRIARNLRILKIIPLNQGLQSYVGILLHYLKKHIGVIILTLFFSEHIVCNWDGLLKATWSVHVCISPKKMKLKLCATELETHVIFEVRNTCHICKTIKIFHNRRGVFTKIWSKKKFNFRTNYTSQQTSWKYCNYVQVLIWISFRIAKF